MSRVCEKCGEEKHISKIPLHKTSLLGPPMTLVNAVDIYSCNCAGEDEIAIPNLKGLKAAAAVTRASLPEKLIGEEIKFLRKATGNSAKDTAKFMEVTPETLSRWENDKLPMNPGNEKLFRAWVVAMLFEDAPAVDSDIRAIMNMEIMGFGRPGHPIEMCFELVRLKERNKTPEDEYTGTKAA